MKKYISSGPDETERIGFRLGKCLKPGDVVGLYGELGSGKTTMVKGIASAFGIRDKDVASASFTIISEYRSVPAFTHIDLYRIEREEEIDEIGLWEHLGGQEIAVIEWAEKAESGLPRDAIKVRLKSLDNNVRDITIEGIDEKSRDNL
jgi:tRNA threonylcarbamoyladenosine biosynthesis protein TsaE